MRPTRLVIACALGLMAGGVCAQESGAQDTIPGTASGARLDRGAVQSPVLVIDFERAFAESAFGRDLNDRITREGAAILAENRRIEAELIAEELHLTEQRATMEPAAFRALATAFDEKVQKLRAEQDAKAEALGTQGDRNREAFLAVARPVLEGMMRESKAAVVLERRNVLVLSEAVDITDEAIAAIDAQVAQDTPADPGPETPKQP